MSQVVASTERDVAAPADRVRQALADYAGTRPRILPEQFSGYRVEAGGTGAGTRAGWRFAATSKRVREQSVDVTAPDEATLVETDRNSSMVTRWTVQPAGPDRSRVAVRTAWNGAGGIGGFFERTFAPRGLVRVYDRMIEALEREVTAG
jgi:Polyketide cyclase / dehydrase and lipid transport